MNTRTIAEKIKQNNFKNKPVIIAIDGFGGAGKSTLAKKLIKELKSATVIEIDDFFLFGVESDANKSNFDRKRLEEQVLGPLRKGETAAYQKYDMQLNTLSSFINIPIIDFLVLEGVSSFHPDIAKYIDYKIWLDAPADAAKERMIKRDRALGREYGDLWDHWTESYQEYKELHKPETRADLIVSY